LDITTTNWLISNTIVTMTRRVEKNPFFLASKNRDHASQSLLLLLARATYIMVLFFAHTPFVVNHTINATPLERLQQYLKGIFNLPHALVCL